MPSENRFSLSGFLEKISPGGPYYKYALGTLIGIGVILIGLSGAIFYNNLRNLISPKPSPTPFIPRPPIKPLPTGFQSWDSSYGPAAKGPRVTTTTVDTLSPPKGSSQTVTVSVKNDSPITKVTADVYTDYQIHTYQMNLAKGTPTDGTWVGIWKLTDSYDYIYHINFTFESPTGNSTSVLSIR